LAKSKNKLRSYFLAQKISRQQDLGNLEDIYKPLITNQNKQLDEAKLTNNKLDETKSELTNILQQLVENGGLTIDASKAIIIKWERLNKGVLADILSAIKINLKQLHYFKHLVNIQMLLKLLKKVMKHIYKQKRIIK